MKRKMLMLLLASLLTAALVTGFSGAWFSELVTGPTATAVTGDVDLTVSATPFDLSSVKLEPGADWVTAGYFFVRNDSDYDIKWRMGLFDVTDGGNLNDFIEVRNVLNPPDKVPSAVPRLYGPLDQDVWAAASVAPVLLRQLEGWNSLAVAGQMPSSVPMPPGYWSWYRVDVRLRSSATNDQADATYTATMKFYATQALNTGW